LKYLKLEDNNCFSDFQEVNNLIKPSLSLFFVIFRPGLCTLGHGGHGASARNVWSNIVQVNGV
jgi:hypothetical protein